MKAYLDQCDSRYPLINGAVFEFCGIHFRLRTNSQDCLRISGVFSIRSSRLFRRRPRFARRNYCTI